MLAGANWQRGGGKGPRPKPIQRPSSAKPTVMAPSVDPDAAQAYLDSLKPPKEVPDGD